MVNFFIENKSYGSLISSYVINPNDNLMEWLRCWESK